MRVITSSLLALMLVWGGVSTARADSQFPPLSYQQCSEKWSVGADGIGYAGDPSEAAIKAEITLCEKAAGESFAYPQTAVQKFQKHFLAAFAMLFATILKDWKQYPDAKKDASAAYNYFLMAQSEAPDAKTKEFIQSLLDMLEAHYPSIKSGETT